MAARPRILIVAEAVTLAHVARAAALATGLDPARHEVCLATDPRYDALLGDLNIARKTISSIPGARFFRAIANGSPIYDCATLRAYVEADLALLDAWRPDVVIGDFRLSLGISARLAGVPYFNLCNAYWSPYARITYPVPDLPLVRVFGVRIAQALFDLSRPLAFALHARALNQTRAFHGLPRLPADLRHAYTEADHVLYADVPELVPVPDLPANHHFLGPVPWSPQLPLPDWWHALPADVPSIYVTLGSSGQARRLPDILRALAPLPVNVMLAHAGHPPAGALPENVWMADFLPGDLAAQRAALVICNGGSPTSYQALAAGVPVIGLASNLDQYLNMSRIAEAGAGLLLRAANAGVSALQAAVRTGLACEAMRRRAEALGVAVRAREAISMLTPLLDTTLGRRAATAARVSSA